LKSGKDDSVLAAPPNTSEKFRQKSLNFRKLHWNYRDLYMLLLVPVVYVIIFHYIPMYGVIMAFKNYQPMKGVWGSPWVGFYHFQRFFTSPNFVNIMRNTLVLSVYGLVAGFPFPIILAVFVNHSRLFAVKKVVQSVTFAPYFISMVILVGLVVQILGMRTGGVNVFLLKLGFDEVNFMGSVKAFPHIYVWSGVWQATGYSAIIYISTLAAVDPNLHEAALIDGATLWQRVWHIDLTTIRPIIVIMLILSMGSILGGNFEKIYLMQTPQNISVSEVIATYVYKVGLIASRPDFSFGTAIGLFQNLVGIILTLTVNRITKTLTGDSMF
jgi:multiple sugar transport system permease protein/putative aldouronate transport system permease protein